MGYIEQSLGANEVVHYRARKPFLLRAFGWCVLLLTIAASADIYLHGYDFLAVAANCSWALRFSQSDATPASPSCREAEATTTSDRTSL